MSGASYEKVPRDDNSLVSVVAGHINQEMCHPMDRLLSCLVLSYLLTREGCYHSTEDEVFVQGKKEGE